MDSLFTKFELDARLATSSTLLTRNRHVAGQSATKAGSPAPS